MNHRLQRIARGRLEVGAQRVRDRDQRRLRDPLVRDAQDLVRLALSLVPYVQGGIPGITAYLNQIQIIELVEANDWSKSRFEETDGFEMGEDEDADEGEEEKGNFSDLNSKDMFASFADNWTTVVLWTKADRDAIRAALEGANPIVMSQ